MINGRKVNSNGQSFQQWMVKVDDEMVAICGLIHSEIEDFCYYDAWADNTDPADTAKEALEAAGF